MSKKVDYSIKFYKGKMTNENQESFNFYLAARSDTEAKNHIVNHVESHRDRFHILPGENDILDISISEVSVENYGKSYGHEIIN